jgi:hypothetical protein
MVSLGVQAAFQARRRASMGKNRNGNQSSGKTEWSAPPALVAAVAAELGLDGFDLDPAARPTPEGGRCERP